MAFGAALAFGLALATAFFAGGDALDLSAVFFAAGVALAFTATFFLDAVAFLEALFGFLLLFVELFFGLSDIKRRSRGWRQTGASRGKTGAVPFLTSKSKQLSNLQKK